MEEALHQLALRWRPRHPLHDAVEHVARVSAGRDAFTEEEHALVVLSLLVWVAAIVIARRCARRHAALNVLAAAAFPRAYVAVAAFRKWALREEGFCGNGGVRTAVVVQPAK